MSQNILNAEALSRMFLSGARNLDQKKDWINELNVFPVPDGDTGTNMTMTILAAAREIENLTSVDMSSLCKAISSGSLRGARGNSGVILSQLFRGFTRTIRDNDCVDLPLIAEACEKAVETAYKAVIKPKEGTILTVAKGIAEMARKEAESGKTVEEYFGIVLEHGKSVLEKTPEMLPVLKEAGVVDSGGQGLIVVLEGAYQALLGNEICAVSEKADDSRKASVVQNTAEEEILFGYCTEFIVDLADPLPKERLDEFRHFLLLMGDSIVLVPDTELVKVHVHTNDPGKVISEALTLGSLSNIKIDNMRLEHREKLIRDAEKLAEQQAELNGVHAGPPKKTGFISVCAGNGFKEIFEGLSVDVVIEGGQTMNPSTEDLLNAIDRVHAENIFLFPNNKNIILSANQAKDLVQEKNIIVVPTKTIPQGISAILAFDANESVENNQEIMRDVLGRVKTGEITYAVRDTHIDSVEIHQGDIMAVGDEGLLHAGTDIHCVCMEAVRKMMFDGAELISVYFGKDLSEEHASRLAEDIAAQYPNCDVEIENGGQPVYYCIISVE
ncbi:MAG: DAK2 domain-containing protein [Eubacterium sp.]|nr:DAK2 domain-containing protein [Eubacterium sp.]